MKEAKAGERGGPGERVFVLIQIWGLGIIVWSWHIRGDLNEVGRAVSVVFQAKRGNGHVTNQFTSVAQSCLTLCDPMNCSMPGLPVHHQLPKFTQAHVNRVSDAIQPFYPLLSASPPAPNPSQHQGLSQWVNSSHEVAKVLEFQPQHQSFQWTPRTYITMYKTGN